VKYFYSSMMSVTYEARKFESLDQAVASPGCGVALTRGDLTCTPREEVRQGMCLRARSGGCACLREG